jgi:DNA-binding NtrC family response regulator
MNKMRHNTILVVDDEANTRSALRRLLYDEYQVHQAADAGEGFICLKKFPIDAIIADHQMPSMTGVDFLKTVREKYPDIIRIVLTGKADLGVTMEAINKGQVHGFFIKPWRNEELTMFLRNVLKQHDLVLENRRLAETIKTQSDRLRMLEKRYPGITTVHKDSTGAIILE